MWRCWRGNDHFFCGDRPHFGLHYRGRVPEKWCSSNRKHPAALGTIANMQCGPQKPTSLTPLVYTAPNRQS